MFPDQKRSGIFLFPYVMQYLKTQTITPRAAILLGHVDVHINPFWMRHKEASQKPDFDPKKPVSLRPRRLQKILHANRATVKAIIDGLVKYRPQILKAKQLKNYFWDLNTRPRSEQEQRAKGGMVVPPAALSAFEDGIWTATETLFYAKIYSFTHYGRPCFLTNEQIGEIFGIKANSAKKIITSLVRKKALKRTSKIIGNSNIMRFLKAIPYEPQSPVPAKNQPAINNATHLEGFPMKQGTRLKKILLAHKSDLAKIKVGTLAESVFRLIDKRKISKDRISDVTKWLKDHYADKFTPKLYRKDDFENNFQRFEDAMNRWYRENNRETPQEESKYELYSYIRNRYWEIRDDEWLPRGQKGYTMRQKLNAVLVEFDLEPNSITSEELFDG